MNNESSAETSSLPVEKPSSRIWSRAKIVAVIRELHDQGVDLSPTAIQKSHSALFSSARSRSHFGTWRAAIVAAELDYDQIKRLQQRWSRESILDQIRDCHAAGEELLHPDFKARHRSLYLAACAHRYFGSWRRAVETAGLNHETMREERVWTRARIERTIRDLASQNQPLSWSKVESKCPGIYRAARRPENFGSWQNALATAGVTAKPERRGRRAGTRHASLSPRSSHSARVQESQVATQLQEMQLQEIRSQEIELQEMQHAQQLSHDLAHIADAVLDVPQAPVVNGEEPQLSQQLRQKSRV